jgi:tRNA pseudouridine55 synthase
MSGVKRYRATLKLGVETDTQDPTGRVIEQKSVKDLDPARVREEASRFIGDIEQVPPMFSAVKVRGQRAYHLARQGIQMDLKKRRVTIYAWNSISVDLPFVAFEVTCSAGTYIRTLGADLGQALGPGGHLVSLRRLSSGSFDVGAAVDSALIRDDRIPYPLDQNIIPLSEALPDMKEVPISTHMANKIKDGYQPKGSDLFPGNNRSRLEADLYKLLDKTELVAVISVQEPYHNDRPKLRIERVFH